MMFMAICEGFLYDGSTRTTCNDSRNFFGRAVVQYHNIIHATLFQLFKHLYFKGSRRFIKVWGI